MARGREADLGVPGMSDYYRDRVRHGGILSNGFISTNQRLLFLSLC